VTQAAASTRPDGPSRLLESKRCLVTGGSRGLGRAICRAFVEHGARLAFTYANDDEDATETESLIARATPDAEVRLFKGDVADATHARAVVAALREAWGGIDVLVNNAGITQVLPISLLEEDDWDLVMNVNVKGPYLFSRAALRDMIKNKSGRILNIGNFASERVIEAPIHYAASKSALRGMTEALAREVGRYGIAVNLLAPGMLTEGMSLGLPQHRRQEYINQCPAGRLGDPRDIAELAAFIVSDANTFMSGAKIVADGGL
jgi:NAD(P)-dependent dehydrogenase (short-subunit alcohol dehydrogenase family)